MRFFLLVLGSWLKADYGQAEGLYAAFAKISQRNLALRSGAVNSLVLMGFFLFIYGVLFALIAVTNENLILSSTLIFLITSLFTVFLVINDYYTVLLNPDERELIGWYPIDSAALLAAKLAILFRTFTLLTGILNLPAAVVFSWRPPSYLFSGLAFWITSVTVNLCALLLLVFMYLWLLKSWSASRLKKSIAYVQTVFFAVVFAGFAFFETISEMLEDLLQDLDPAWLFVPIFWPAAIVQLSRREFSATILIRALALPVFTIALATAALRYVSSTFRERLYQGGVQAHKPQRRRLERLLLLGVKGPENWAVLKLSAIHLRDDWRLKASLVLLPVYFFYFGVGHVDRRAIVDSFAGTPGFGNFFVFIFVMLVLSPLALQLLSRSLFYKAVWVFLISELDRVKVALAVRQAVRRIFLYPYLVCVASIFLYQIPNPLHGLLMAALLGLLGEFFVSVFHHFMMSFPFSRPHDEQQSRTLMIFLSMIPIGLLGVGASLLIYFLAFRSYVTYVLSLGILSTLFLLLNQIFKIRARRRYSRLEFLD